MKSYTTTTLEHPFLYLLTKIASREEFAISITSGVLETTLPDAPQELSYHKGILCSAIKEDTTHREICRNFKTAKMIALLKEGIPFFSVCPFGILDYVFPLTFANKNVGSGFITYQCQQLEPQNQERSKWTIESSIQLAEKNFNEIKEEMKLIASLIQNNIPTFLEKKMVKKLPRPDDLLTSVHNILCEYYTDTITLTKIANKIGVTPSLLAHNYKTRYGVTVHEQLTIKRVERSIALLKEGASVTEAGVLAGFPNGAYFSRIFKNYTGLSPAIWRKKHTIEWSSKI